MSVCSIHHRHRRAKTTRHGGKYHCVVHPDHDALHIVCSLPCSDKKLVHSQTAAARRRKTAATAAAAEETKPATKKAVPARKARASAADALSAEGPSALPTTKRPKLAPVPEAPAELPCLQPVEHFSHLKVLALRGFAKLLFLVEICVLLCMSVASS